MGADYGVHKLMGTRHAVPPVSTSHVLGCKCQSLIQKIVFIYHSDLDIINSVRDLKRKNLFKG
jgi:hypothetical protein